MAYAVGNNGCCGGLYKINVSDPGNPQYDAECVTNKDPNSRYTGREICRVSRWFPQMMPTPAQKLTDAKGQAHPSGRVKDEQERRPSSATRRIC